MNRFFIVLILLVTIHCKQPPKENTSLLTMDGVVDWLPLQEYYLEHMEDAVSYLDTLAQMPMTGSKTKEVFAHARISFKKAEPYGSYLNPSVGHRANGPALPIVTDDSQKVLLPFGLQKIEESIYEENESEERYRKEISLTKALLKNLQKNIKNRKITPQRFFIATHQQLMRILSFSISGFDTPVSQLGIQEAIVSLESLKEVYEISMRSLILSRNADLDAIFIKNINDAIAFAAGNMDFESFDRYSFIRDYMNPITRTWVAIRKQSGIWEGTDSTPYNFDAPTFFEEDSFNLSFFTPPINRNPTESRIALGKKLFFDPKLSQNGRMACVTCHHPENAWADGKVVNLDNNGEPLQRNTPTLLNAAFQQSFFWDGRSPNLLDQIAMVFTNTKEFDSSIHQFSTEILQDSKYIRLFKDAYGQIPTKNTDIIRAISSYIGTLTGFNSKFDKNIRAEEDSFTKEEKQGFNLYMGKALCATCHFIPLTNGTVPPFFMEHEKEVIGVPETMANAELDDDLGFYWRFNKELEVHRGMFKTPTIRNADRTAPYMHNGVYQTLEQVMDFYNKGGGSGLGFALEYQTLPFDNLNLSKQELDALVAFVKTLSDEKLEMY